LNEDAQATGRNLSTGNNLLQFLGTWAGDDLEELLQDVYATRGEIGWRAIQGLGTDQPMVCIDGLITSEVTNPHAMR